MKLVFLDIDGVMNSMTGVASKFAGRAKFLSLRFVVLYGIVLALNFGFALMWQQILKHMSLTFAFMNKPITVIYSLIWGALLFGEKVTPKMVIGALVILTGIVIGVSGND